MTVDAQRIGKDEGFMTQKEEVTMEEDLNGSLAWKGRKYRLNALGLI